MCRNITMKPFGTIWYMLINKYAITSSTITKIENELDFELPNRKKREI
jgi:hypothetical protein